MLFMNRMIVFTFVLFAAIFSPGQGRALPISAVMVFGDSLSDSGNVFLATGGAVDPIAATPPSPPYFAGRFSNGPNYADVLASGLGLPLGPSLAGGTNFAWGGARSGVDGLVPSVGTQVLLFLGGVGGVADPSSLYVVFGGGNDVRDSLFEPTLADQLALIGDAVVSLFDAITALASAGATRFLVPNVPNVGLIPEVTALDGVFPGIAALAAFLSASFNAELAAAIDALRAGFPGISIKELDTFALISTMIADPASFGFTNVTDACLDPITFIVCSDPDSYLFWDTIHPTAAGHELLGLAAREAIPEPATLLLFGFGLLGLGAMKRRKKTA